MTHYEKATLVMDYLQGLGLNMLTIGRAIDDSKFQQSYQAITENPKITKREFLDKVGIEEVED